MDNTVGLTNVKMTLAILVSNLALMITAGAITHNLGVGLILSVVVAFTTSFIVWSAIIAIWTRFPFLTE